MSTEQFSEITPNAIMLRRAILDWRDKHTELAANHLRHELPVLFKTIDKKLNEISIREKITNRKIIGKKHLEPVFRDWLEQEVSYIQDDATSEFQIIITRAIECDLSQQLLSDSTTPKFSLNVAKTTAANKVSDIAVSWSIEKYQKKLQKIISEAVLGSANVSNSVLERLNISIENTATKMLKAIFK